MADSVISTEPDGAPRIGTLDVLRGIAILGILFMNVNDMGASFAYPDLRHLGWTAADRIAWWTREILADGTARALLEMLFGAGMVILTERIAAGSPRWAAMRRYYWRNVVLLAFGLIHMFVLLWPGDILHTYGVAALIAFLFRRLRLRWLIALGLLGATIQIAVVGSESYGAYTIVSQGNAAAAKRAEGQPLSATDRGAIKALADRNAKRAKDRAEIAQEVAAEDRQRSGSAAGWIAAAWTKSVERLTDGEIFGIWEAAGTMLIGAALFRLGILQGARTRTFYLRMMLICYALAATWRAIGAYQETRFDDAVHWHWILTEYARLGMTLGHVGLICLLLGTAAGARWLRPFAAAGRTALTIYVLQTIVFVWIVFPPWGLALYGRLGWAGMMLISAALDAVLLIAAVAWVKRYRIAPVEWAWRSIVEGRRLPFRSPSAAAV